MKWTLALNNELRLQTEYNLESVKAFADKHGISYRSVIPQVKKLDLTYFTKTGKSKSVATVTQEPMSEITGIRGAIGGNKIPTSYLAKF